MFRPEKIQRLAAAVVLCAVAIVVLELSGLLTAIFGFSVGLVSSVASPLYGLSTEIAPSDKDGSCVSAEEMETLQLENSRLRTLVAENAALKTALSFRERASERMVLARVLSSSTDPTFAGLAIDRGESDGLTEGQAVVVGDGIVIGKIHRVGRYTSSVLLLSDSLSRLAVSIQGGSGTLGVLEGDRGVGLSISLIPQNERISPGDIVITSGLEPGIAAGLVAGTVEKVQHDSQEPFQTVTVLPFKSSERPIMVQVLVPLPLDEVVPEQESDNPYLIETR